MKVTRGSGLLEVFLAKKRAKLANSLITKSQRSGRILDVGCGSYPYFLTTTKFKEKYGIDPSVSLSLVKDSGIILKKIKINKNTLPFANNYFDVVTMLAVFEHIENNDLITVIKEIKRVLKKDGVLIITTPAPWSDNLLHNMARVGLISSEEIHEHKHNHSKSKIENLLKEAGFEKSKIKSGFFELYMNMWFTAKK
jgi:ubiquinone/menaquinone biosynthesis C-methylase UbiE